jgi:hypothetical protein
MIPLEWFLQYFTRDAGSLRERERERELSYETPVRIIVRGIN